MNRTSLPTPRLSSFYTPDLPVVNVKRKRAGLCVYTSLTQ
jgi:hypothetical protein